MARVDFYVLKASGGSARDSFACRLAEKAYRLKNSVHIHAENQQNAKRLDELLWTFRDGSFVPHEIVETHTPDSAAPVTIGSDPDSQRKCDLLINLGDAVPKSAAEFGRIAEIVSADDESKTQSRNRFVQYRDDGHTLETHKL